MAKARKPKLDDSGPLVRHQKLCLALDLLNRRIYGYTELEIAVPESGIIGLHADNLEIESVRIDGEVVQYDVFPHYQPVEIENRWCSVSTATTAADAAGATYISALDRELMPNLLIFCPKGVGSSDQLEGENNGELDKRVNNGEQEKVENNGELEKGENNGEQEKGENGEREKGENNGEREKRGNGERENNGEQEKRENGEQEKGENGEQEKGENVENVEQSSSDQKQVTGL